MKVAQPLVARPLPASLVGLRSEDGPDLDRCLLVGEHALQAHVAQLLGIHHSATALVKDYVGDAVCRECRVDNGRVERTDFVR